METHIVLAVSLPCIFYDCGTGCLASCGLHIPTLFCPECCVYCSRTPTLVLATRPKRSRRSRPQPSTAGAAVGGAAGVAAEAQPAAALEAISLQDRLGVGMAGVALPLQVCLLNNNSADRRQSSDRSWQFKGMASSQLYVTTSLQQLRYIHTHANRPRTRQPFSRDPACPAESVTLH